MATKPVLNIETQDDLGERLRKKLNNNFRSLVELFERVYKIATDPYYHFNTLYPVGCFIWTQDEDDPRLRYGIWEKRENTILVSDGSIYGFGSTYENDRLQMDVVTNVSGEGISVTKETIYRVPTMLVCHLYERID